MRWFFRCVDVAVYEKVVMGNLFCLCTSPYMTYWTCDHFTSRGKWCIIFTGKCVNKRNRNSGKSYEILGERRLHVETILCWNVEMSFYTLWKTVMKTKLLTQFVQTVKSIRSSPEQRVATNSLYQSLFQACVWACWWNWRWLLDGFIQFVTVTLCFSVNCCMFALSVHLMHSSCLLPTLHSTICHWSEL